MRRSVEVGLEQGCQTREISQRVRLLILKRHTASDPERLRAIQGPKAFDSALPCASYPFHESLRSVFWKNEIVRRERERESRLDKN